MKEKDLKKRLRYCDWIVGITTFFMLLVHAVSVATLMKIQEISGAKIESIAAVFEANPFASMAGQLTGIGALIGAMILPAIALSIYLYMRRKVKDKKIEITCLEYTIHMVFFAMLINIVNDAAHFFGIIWRFM